MPAKIVISGATGRMGQTLVRLARENTHLEVIGGIDRERKAGSDAAEFGMPVIETADSCGDLIDGADVVLDFSAAAGLQSLLQQRSSNLAGRSIVVGTTGLPAEVLGELSEMAGKSAVIIAANFSIGVNLLLGLVDAAARVLDADRFDVEIVEAHHRMKVDAPSGTALALGQAVANARGTPLDTVRADGRSGHTGKRPTGEIAFHALRGGDVVGEHYVHFIGARERIEIVHKAQDRALFAEGALIAAQWIAGKKPGMYSMQEVLGLPFLQPDK
jgi:4-hydroxy-tetrahydrodipicolinate reductase